LSVSYIIIAGYWLLVIFLFLVICC